MIARAVTPAARKRFVRACRGAPGLEVLLPVERALFARSQPGRFYAGPGLALDVGGPEALAAGGANPEELAAFLQFCGCSALITNGTAPAGWRADGHLYGFALAAGAQLPEPAADEALWASLALDAAPPAGELAAFLYPAGPQRDDYYSALCTKRVRGLAQVWALTREGTMAATIGAYAIRDGKAYLACGCTAEPLRGRGAGGRLAVRFANALAGQGLEVCLLCRGERTGFYTRLGFAPAGALARYTNETGKESYA